MDTSNTTKSSSKYKRRRIIVGTAIIGLIVVLFAGWWLFFRDTAPASVNSAEAEQARCNGKMVHAENGKEHGQRYTEGDQKPRPDVSEKDQ